MPEWLRFFKGIVDRKDLALNTSRETMLDAALLDKFGRILTKIRAHVRGALGRAWPYVREPPFVAASRVFFESLQLRKGSRVFPA